MNPLHSATLLAFALSSLPLYSDFVQQIPVANNATSSEYYQSFTPDGTWCWFADPRAVYHEGTRACTYSTWVDRQGCIWLAEYDHKTRKQNSVIIHQYFQRDDHAVPALLIDKTGHINVFYSKHGDKEGIKLARSAMPESIEKWEKTQIIAPNDSSIASQNYSTGYTYCHPVQLKDADDKIFIHWRGMNYKPTIASSDDGGRSWSKGKIFFSTCGIKNNVRPYTKIYSNGDKKIHYIETDAHPRNNQHNSVYYFYADKDGYYKADGSKIELNPECGVDGKLADLVYDGAAGKGRAWIWDVAEDAQGHPRIAFVRFPDNEHHIYCYAAWNGQKWIVEELIDSGKWFPQTTKGKTETEPNYSAGLSIDKEDPSILYLSVKREGSKHFEIEKWQKTEQGWLVEAITKNSPKDNVRPVAVTGAQEGNPLQVMWMQNTHYVRFVNNAPYNKRQGYLTSIKGNFKQRPVIDPLNKEQVLNKLSDVANWQLANPIHQASDPRDWVWGAFYVGLVELYKMTKNPIYLQEIINQGNTHEWKLMKDYFHADRMTIADVWCSVAEITGDKRYVADVEEKMAAHITRGFADFSPHFKYPLRWWVWCDTLFMAPPTFARMSNLMDKPEYITYVSEAWKKTKDYLYDKEEHLYYRDEKYFDKRSESGKKIFWGRGNGWVIGGLVRVLDQLPAGHPSRTFFEEHFKEMMDKLLTLQRADGLWTTSLLDSADDTMSETSASAFILYGLIWGINEGLVDARYTERALNAWRNLLARVDDRGCLGYVQRVAAGPGIFSAEDWQLYASGALMLVGKEVLRMQEKAAK